MSQSIACVTGASGLIGLRIVRWLIAHGFVVRVLSRKWLKQVSGVEVFEGSLLDDCLLARFLCGADFVFHCAAELKNDAEMWRTNVEGTEKLLGAAERSKVVFFCNLSSVGVIGKTACISVDESTPCAPQNDYERSKLAAEQIVLCSRKIHRIVVLRPTNVVAPGQPGALSIAMRGSAIDVIKTLLQGRECAHIVHVENVAAAALHAALNLPLENPEVYIVSSDHEPLNTFSGLWQLYRSLKTGLPVKEQHIFTSLPVVVPNLFRRMLRRKGNKGDVRYSSKKLLSTNFVFPYSLRETVEDVALGSTVEL